MPPLPSPQVVPAAAYATAGAIGWAGAERLAGAVPGRRSRLPRTTADPVRTSPNALPPPTEVVAPPEDPRRLRPVALVPVVAGLDGGRRADDAAPLRRPRPPIRNRCGSAVASTLARRSLRRGSPSPRRPARRPLTTPIGSAPRPASGGAVRRAAGRVPDRDRGAERAEQVSGRRPAQGRGVCPVPRAQVDANGEETWTPLYHAKARRADEEQPAGRSRHELRPGRRGRPPREPVGDGGVGPGLPAARGHLAFVLLRPTGQTAAPVVTVTTTVGDSARRRAATPAPGTTRPGRPHRPSQPRPRLHRRRAVRTRR